MELTLDIFQTMALASMVFYFGKYLKEKIINLRIFEDENEKLNKSLLDIGGDTYAYI